MPDIWVQKEPSGRVVPMDDQGRDYLKKIKVGEPFVCKLTKPRNVKFHRKYFALLNLVFENQDKYEDFDAFRKEIIMRAGYWTEHHHLTGTISYQAKSIAFHKMDELEFDDLYSKTIDVILKYFMPDIDPKVLKQAVADVMGFA